MWLLLFACLSLVATGTATGNMNGAYVVASVNDVGVSFNDDYASKGHEYFDVWAPEIATHYGEVFWTNQGSHPLPPSIVKRFQGKVMAITGYEQDQVMVVPTGQPGLHPEQDVSVPINWAYNHHYMMHMTGTHSRMKEVSSTETMFLDVSSHGAPTKWIAVDRESPGTPRRFGGVAPTSLMFSEGNGGESRKSFHGYPDGFAQLIESPTSWNIQPMQIDSRNRDCGSTYKDVGNCTKMTPGYEPRAARYGRGWQGVDKPALSSNYSGVVECPCTSRYGGDPMFYPDSKTKHITHNFESNPTGPCASNQGIATAAMCFSVVRTIGIAADSFINKSVADASLPAGCSVVTTEDGTTGRRTAEAIYNTGGNAPCGANATRHVGVAVSDIGVTLRVDLLSSDKDDVTMARGKKGSWCADNHVNVLASFKALMSSVPNMTAALAQCEAFCLGHDACAACSADYLGGPGFDVQFSALVTCGHVNSWGGAVVGDISTKTRFSSGSATITMAGPADVWFAVGLDAANMADQPYTLVATPDNNVTERQLGTCGSEAEHCPGDQLVSSLKVISNSVISGRRTVVVTRPLRGLTAKHYTFLPKSVGTLRFISAVGSGAAFAYHAHHAQSQVTFTIPNSPTCLCDKGTSGELCETGQIGCASFTKNCLDHDQGGDLLAQNNPTCASLHYSGGLRCCGHKRILLDADQEIRPELLQYHMKFRFWFQEFVPENATKTPQGTSKPTNASHYHLPRIYFQTEADAGEYDIPPAFATAEYPLINGYDGYPVGKLTPGTTCVGSCPDGDDCECHHTITYNHTVSNMRLIYAGGHCHAPSCLGIWLYRNDPGHEMELLCHQRPVYGTGHVDVSKGGDKYDEAGYVMLPPCLWGDDAGLHPSVLLPPNTELVSVKKNRNTHAGHYGEMASWQMRGVNF